MLLEDHLAQFGPPPYAAADALAGLVPSAAESVVVRCAAGADAVPPDLAALWLAPHLVLDGLQLTATAVGAADAYLDLGQAPSPRLRASLQQVIAERDLAALDLVPAWLDGAPAGTTAVTLTAEALAQVALIARYGPDAGPPFALYENSW